MDQPSCRLFARARSTTAVFGRSISPAVLGPYSLSVEGSCIVQYRTMLGNPKSRKFLVGEVENFGNLKILDRVRVKKFKKFEVNI